MEITIKGTAKEVSQFLLETILPPDFKLCLGSRSGKATFPIERVKEQNEATQQQGQQASPIDLRDYNAEI